MEEKTLAKQIAETFLHLDPYLGIDQDELEEATIDMMTTKEGCMEVLRQLSELVLL